MDPRKLWKKAAIFKKKLQRKLKRKPQEFDIDSTPAVHASFISHSTPQKSPWYSCGKIRLGSNKRRSLKKSCGTDVSACQSFAMAAASAYTMSAKVLDESSYVMSEYSYDDSVEASLDDSQVTYDEDLFDLHLGGNRPSRTVAICQRPSTRAPLQHHQDMTSRSRPSRQAGLVQRSRMLEQDFGAELARLRKRSRAVHDELNASIRFEGPYCEESCAQNQDPLLARSTSGLMRWRITGRSTDVWQTRVFPTFELNVFFSRVPFASIADQSLLHYFCKYVYTCTNKWLKLQSLSCHFSLCMTIGYLSLFNYYSILCRWQKYTCIWSLQYSDTCVRFRLRKFKE